MPIKARACVTCRATTTPARIEKISGEDSSLVLTIRDLPSLSCAKGHRQLPYRDFPAQLLQRLVENEEGLPAAAQKGLLFKHFFCRACGQQLKTESDHRQTYTVDIALSEFDPFQVELSIPVFTCGACGQDQLHSVKEIRSRTPAALAHAFQAASIPPA